MIAIGLGSIIIFTFILVINMNLTTFGNIDKLTLLESLIIILALLGIYLIEPNEYYMFYAILVILFLSYTFIRKISIYIQNIYFRIIIMSFIIAKMGISIYRFLVSDSFAEKYMNEDFSIFIIFTGIIILILSSVKRKSHIKFDKYTNQRMLYYNVILFILILLSHYFFMFIVRQVSNPKSLYLLIDISLTVTLITIIWFNHTLKKYHKKNLKLITDLTMSNEKLRKSYRKNHNVSNLIITINYLLKEKEYERCKNYINDFKGEINET